MHKRKLIFQERPVKHNPFLSYEADIFLRSKLLIAHMIPIKRLETALILMFAK